MLRADDRCGMDESIENQVRPGTHQLPVLDRTRLAFLAVGDDHRRTGLCGDDAQLGGQREAGAAATAQATGFDGGEHGVRLGARVSAGRQVVVERLGAVRIRAQQMAHAGERSDRGHDDVNLSRSAVTVAASASRSAATRSYAGPGNPISIRW